MLLKRIFLSGPLLLIGIILCLTFAFQAVTAKTQSEHQIRFYPEEILLDLIGTTRVDLNCNKNEFNYVSTWNEILQVEDYLTFSDLLKRNYPEILLTKLDEACSNNFNPRTTDKVIYALGALILGTYFVWGFRSLMKSQ
jgi:hypothetical protein